MCIEEQCKNNTQTVCGRKLFSPRDVPSIRHCGHQPQARHELWTTGRNIREHEYLLALSLRTWAIPL